jgi:PAS domain S-box-containing protein
MIAESRRILVVEDEPGAATLQRRRLERAGFRVALARDVEAAMDLLGRVAVDLVVIDYRLGTTTGLDLNRRMKAAGFDVPVIIVSGAIDDATVIEAMRAGVKDVVVKNLDYLDYLPEAVQAVLRQSATVPERVGPEGPQTVLVVEDDEAVATLERRQLERAGYHVEVTPDVESAVAAVRQGQVNVALIDLRLGEGSGLDLYERLKTEGWHVPAILVTGHADQAVAIRALRAGMRDVVPKSAEYLEYLPDAVDRVAAQARVERKLVESEQRLASIIGTTLDAIVMCDEQLRVVLFNRSAEAMFGVVAAQALTMSLPAFVPALRSLAGRAAAEPLQRRMEVEAQHAYGGQTPIEVSVSEVLVNGRRLYTVIARDITERRRSEEELREADRRKDMFLGMLAHELRNPLAAIASAGEVLHRTIADATVQKLSGVIRRQTRALARMVDDLLDVSRVTLGKIQLTHEPLVLQEVVGRSIEAMKDEAARARVRLEAHMSDDPIWVRGDVTRLEQVLSNLLANAVKFTPSGGAITVAAGREGAEAVLRVKDTGIGIEPALLPRIFELFVQGDTSLDRAKSGLGIGLALVRQVVMLHGGDVTASSGGAGAGAEFVVRLPAAEVDQVAEGETVGERRPAGVVDVLVVDDQLDLADSMVLMVESLGHRARAVYSGADAITAARARVPDLMLLDLGMPRMTGYELARLVREDPDLRRVRLVALTGYGSADDRARTKAAGFDHHVTKPLSDTALLELLDATSGAGREA